MFKISIIIKGHLHSIKICDKNLFFIQNYYNKAREGRGRQDCENIRK